MNGVDLPSGRLLHAKTQEKRGDLKNLLCKEYRITSLLLWYIWFASAFSAYGVFFVSPVIIQNGYLGTADNSTLENSFEDSSQVIPCLKFTNQNFIDLLWTSAAEFPGLLVFTFLAEKCRRKVLEDFGKRNMPGKRARRHFSQLSEFERGLIIGMKTAGWSMRRVAGQVDRSECAVRNC
ncbi:synaptic vesicle 2-related protein [Trichonephila clavipes]|nr:synaptic vesicle 2-related protein [Trichonephila clavipes]